MKAFTHKRYFRETVFLVDTDDVNEGYKAFVQYLENLGAENIDLGDVKNWVIFNLHAPDKIGGEDKPEKGQARADNLGDESGLS